VIRLGAVGDVVRTLPAVSALRAAYPGARISWLVEPASASVLSGQPWIDEILVYPRAEVSDALFGVRWLEAGRRLARFVAALRADAFDLVVDFHSILKSGVFSRLSGAPLRVAYAPPYGREAGWRFANHRAQVEPRRASRFERNRALVQFLGVDAAPDARPLRVADAARQRMARLLEPASAPVVIHPGTSDDTPHKRWTVSGYTRVARDLAEETGTPVLVTVGPARDDRAFAEALVEEAGGAARRAPDTPTLGDLAALFARARLYIGSDSGPMHVASLVGTPVLQLLGPTHPLENAPWQATPSRSVRVPVACSPCRRGCAAATCMRVIPPDRVVQEARALLAGAIGH